jgi:hypothetical protein
MNNNAKIMVVVPVGPKDDMPDDLASTLEKHQRFAWVARISVINGRKLKTGPRPSILRYPLASPKPTGEGY